MLRMCRSSAKFGGMYLRRDKWKNASYSRNASASRSGVKKEPTVGTIRLSLLRRGSERCSCKGEVQDKVATTMV